MENSEMTGAGALLHADKFLWMADNETAKLQALNIPCVQVGMATLSQSAPNDYISSLAMNNVRFFSNSAGDRPKIWATGSVTGSYTGATSGTLSGTAAGVVKR